MSYRSKFAVQQVGLADILAAGEAFGESIMFEQVMYTAIAVSLRLSSDYCS